MSTFLALISDQQLKIEERNKETVFDVFGVVFGVVLGVVFGIVFGVVFGFAFGIVFGCPH